MTKKDVPTEVPMRKLKINTCPSLSGRSTLTYHVLCNAEGSIHLRVVANSGSGQFNSDAIPFSQIERLLSDHEIGKPMTSSVLRSAFVRKSTNSPAFLFAALLAESVVAPGPDKDSGYVLGKIEAFKQSMSALAANDTNLEVATDAPVSQPKGKHRKKEKA